MATKTRKTYVSKGERQSISKSTIRLVRESRTTLEKMANKSKAWREGKNPWLTIDNPVKNQTNKPRIRVRANEYWGDPKKLRWTSNGEPEQ